MALLLFIISALITAQTSHAAPLPDPTSLPNMNSLISPEITNAFIKTIGLAADTRPYEPATPLGTKLGLNMGIEVTLSKVPQDLGTAMISAGGSGGGDGALGLPVMPIARLHLHKGFGEKIDLGAEGIYYKGYNQIVPIRIYGCDGKLAFWTPEEGPTAALRVSYTNSRIWFISTSTWTAELLVSRKLEFADPYIGIGGQWARGTLAFPIEVMGTPVVLTSAGAAYGFLAFTGVQFTIPNLGLQLTLEGSYSTADVHALGTKFGFAF